MISRQYQVFVPFLFLLGMFVPTSINTHITNVISMIGCGILLILLVVLLIKQKSISKYSIAISISINFLLWFYTFTSPFSERRFGTSIYFFILTLIFLLDFKKLKINFETYRKIFQIVNIIFFIFSFGMIIQFYTIFNFLDYWYSAYYDKLLPNMFHARKPVVTFGTHSIAGFYFFVFFFMNVITYNYSKKKSHLLSSIIYMVLLFFIKSSTSLVYLLLCFPIIAVFLLKRFKLSKKSTIIFSTALIFLITILSIRFQALNVFQLAKDKLLSDNNGLLVRYSASGVLSKDINFITSHPFRGIGFSYSPRFVYVDSGIVEYSLRGSVLVLFLILLGLYFFLKRNLNNKMAFFLFLLFLSFEVGFGNLIYFRSLFIIPFVVAYLYKIITKKEHT